jgi:hypothetical protein
MTVHVVRRAAEGVRVTPREAIAAGLEAFANLFVPILLVALGVMLGLIALIIPGLILAVRWAVVPQVVVLEKVTGTAALRRSAALVSGQGWFTFLVLLVANLLVGLFGLIFTVPLELAAKSADTQALSLLGQVLGQLFALPMLAVAVTLLYYTLRATPEQAVAAPVVPAAPPPPAMPDAPEPDHDAFGRRRDEGWEPPVKDY